MDIRFQILYYILQFTLSFDGDSPTIVDPTYASKSQINSLIVT